MTLLFFLLKNVDKLLAGLVEQEVHNILELCSKKFITSIHKKKKYRKNNFKEVDL